MNDKIRISLLKQIDKDIQQYFENVKWYYWVKEIEQDYKIFRKTAFKIIKAKKLKSFYLINY